MFLKTEIPTSQKYFANLFPNLQLEWKDIYMLPRKVSMDTKLRIFQYKILNNILYLNKQLFTFKKTNTKLCSFCKLQDEIINHLFVECNFSIMLWRELKVFCQLSFVLPALDPQSATFGFFEIDPELFLILNHILLLYKYYFYSSRDCEQVSLAALLKSIKKVFVLEKHLSLGNEKKTEAFNKKWTKMMSLNNF